MNNNTFLNRFRGRVQAPGVLTAGVLALSQVLCVGVSAEVIPSTPPAAYTPPDGTKTHWVTAGKTKLNELKSQSYRLPPTRARNVILFIGDGMGVSTMTAARILEGQKVKGSTRGEENLLSFETFPNAAFSRTYSVNQQVSDSAPTMTAMVTGVKTNDGALSVTPDVERGGVAPVSNAQKLKTILEQAKDRGMSAGVVATARVTHATPAACYAHISDRDREADANEATMQEKDIAAQLIDSIGGRSFEVVLGGGRTYFMPNTQNDPEYTATKGRRINRDLIAEWKKLPARITNPVTGASLGLTTQPADNPRSAYVWNKAGFDAINPANVDRLMGLFEPSHMQYEADRDNDTGKEPSLEEMTTKAMDILGKNRNGYFLMVEAGRIDHGHHAGNAYRALTDTIALSNAVKAAAAKAGPDTLIVVTADHSHVFTIAGYPDRGNPILGLVKIDGELYKDSLGLPFTTLGYANGPGYTGAQASGTSGNSLEGSKAFPFGPSSVVGIKSGRPDLTSVATDAKSFLQEATVPLSSETHAGEDVAIFAKGPNAHLFRGSVEQSMIYWIMADALRLPQINAGSAWPQN
jgi:alkaline phosphatase